MSFVEREISVTITLGNGATFAGTKKNSVIISGLMASVTVQKYGLPTQDAADVRIFGVPLSLMNEIGTLWRPLPQYSGNDILVQAGDSKSGMSTVFIGGLHTVWLDLQSQPAASLVLSAQAGMRDALKPVPPTSYNGPTDAAVVLQSIATQMGRRFENNGLVGMMLASPYFPGNLTEQAKSCARAVNAELYLDGNEGPLAVWYPRSSGRKFKSVLVSSKTGMVGYPTFNGSWLSVRTLYNPSIQFGAPVEVESDIVSARGTWFVRALLLNLQSQTPGGAWFSDFQGDRVPENVR